MLRPLILNKSNEKCITLVLLYRWLLDILLSCNAERYFGAYSEKGQSFNNRIISFAIQN
jgi:hypothetical protein